MFFSQLLGCYCFYFPVELLLPMGHGNSSPRNIWGGLTSVNESLNPVENISRQ